MENSMEVPEKIKNRAGKESATMQETWVQSLGWEDPLKKGKATHSSILTWRIGLYCTEWTV